MLSLKKERRSNLGRLLVFCGVLLFLLKATRFWAAWPDQNHKRARHRNLNSLDMHLLQFLFYVISPSYHPPRSTSLVIRISYGSQSHTNFCVRHETIFHIQEKKKKKTNLEEFIMWDLPSDVLQEHSCYMVD